MIKDNKTTAILQDIKTITAGRITLATAESCTGGILSARLTQLDGSSKFFDRGFITYSNKAKEQLLGVQHNTLNQFGAVSEETAIEMATGCLKQSEADLAISVTGIAGPDGGSKQKPVGTVCFSIASTNNLNSYTYIFSGNRDSIRHQACVKALELIQAFLHKYYISSGSQDI